MSPFIMRQWQRAERYLAENQVAAARAVLESILARAPNQPQAQLLLGGIAWKQDRIRAATEHAQAAAACEFFVADLVCDVIAALVQVGETASAHRLFDHPVLKQEKLPVPLLMRLSGQAQANGEHARSLEYLQRARAAGAAGADFLSYLGVQLSFNGQLEEAERELEACVRLDPAAGRAGLILSRLRKQTPERNHLENLRAGLARVQRGSAEHAALEFARYKELEDLRRYEEAWHALENANGTMRSLLKYDPDKDAESIHRLTEATTGLPPPTAGEATDGPQPIFIIGMPRSGTTLLDRVLSNHSRVTDAGELGDFIKQLSWMIDHKTTLFLDAEAVQRLDHLDFAELGRRYLHQTQWRASGSRYYIDKLPANWAVAGLIAQALPAARILHMVRDPLDVCFSNWRAMFGDSYPYSYDLAALARHYAIYRTTMEHWRQAFPGRILDVRYQDLAAKPEETAQRVFAFCGLDFEPGCTDVTRNVQQLATLSMFQAREPVRARGSEQWRPYAEWLAPLQRALAPYL